MRLLRRGSRLLRGIALGMCVLGCRSEPAGGHRKAPSGAPSSSAAPSGSLGQKSAAPRYRVAHVLPKETGVWSVGSRLGLGALRFRAPVELERQVWLIADADTGTALLAPVTPSEVTRPLP